MGNGGAAPIEVEMGEEEARNPTAQFLIKALKKWLEVHTHQLTPHRPPLSPLAWELHHHRPSPETRENVVTCQLLTCGQINFLQKGDFPVPISTDVPATMPVPVLYWDR